MDISIVITSYGTQNYLEKCLDSIQSQTFFKNNKQYEVLVGVDGCYDSLKKLIEIRDKYDNLKIFISPINNGTYVMSNLLIQKADRTSKYFLRFDSDDEMLPTMIEDIMNSDGKIVRFKFNKEDEISRYYAYGQIAYAPEIYFPIGGYHKYNVSADADLILRLQKENKITYIDKPLFKKNERIDSLVHKKDVKINSNYRNYCHDYYEQFRQKENIVKIDYTECISLEELEKRFKDVHGYSITLDNPKTFNEKIWLRKLFQHNAEFINYTDKILVKQYVEDLPQLPYQIAIDFDEIVFKEDVVIKCTHGCMWHVYYIGGKFYNTKYVNITKEEAKEYLETKLTQKYTSKLTTSFQWAYSYVQPKLLVEKYIGKDVEDIKIHIFKGKIKYIKHYKDRIGDTKITIYDSNWKVAKNFTKWSNNKLLKVGIKKPQQLKHIIGIISEQLKNIDYCRVDFLYQNDLMWFNEITLYHGNGLRPIKPYELDLDLGSEWDLKICNTSAMNLHIPEVENKIKNKIKNKIQTIYKKSLI